MIAIMANATEIMTAKDNTIFPNSSKNAFKIFIVLSPFL